MKRILHAIRLRAVQFVVMVLSAIILICVTVSTVDAGQEASLGMTGETQVARLQTVGITLNASDISDLYSMQMEVRYDKDSLSLDRTDIRNLAWSGSQGSYSGIGDELPGKVNLVYSRKGKVPGVNGDVPLVGLSFKALKIGKTTVTISNIKLADSQGNMIRTQSTSITKTIDILPNPLIVKLTGQKGLNGWYVTPVTLEVSDLDASEITYTLDGMQHSYFQPVTISGTGQHSLKVETDDGYGYRKSKEEVVKIDDSAPLITIDNTDYDKWVNYDLILTPEVADGSGSGVEEAWYQWSDTAEQPAVWETYEQGELERTKEGISYLHMKAVDKAGNLNQTVFGPYRIDKTMPGISVDCDKREAWENTDVIVLPEILDEGGSQLERIRYQWSHSETEPMTYLPYGSDKAAQTEEGEWYLHFEAVDHAENRSAATYGPYRIDKSAPDIVFTGVSEGMDYTDEVSPEILISDVLSGVRTQAVLLDGEAYESGTPITRQGTHIITARAEDNSGNTAEEAVTFKVYADTSLSLEAAQAEYSDTYTVHAKLTSHNQAVSGAAITITVDGAELGTCYTDAEGNAELAGTAGQSAGNYAIEAVYHQDDLLYYRPAGSVSSLAVSKEKATISYLGGFQIQYPDSMTIAAVVHQENDGQPGDYTLARVQADIEKLGEDGSYTLVESLTANCGPDGTLRFERSCSKGIYRVKLSILDDGYYSPSETSVNISAYQAGGDDATFGGWVVLPDPATGEPVNVECGFTVKYKTGITDGRFRFLFGKAGIYIWDGKIAWMLQIDKFAVFGGYDGTYTYHIEYYDGDKEYLSIRIWKGINILEPPVAEYNNLP